MNADQGHPAPAAKPAAPTGWPPLVSIVGAPRCGTTSLSRYLRRHPDVLFSEPKEPHFFSRFDLSDVSTETLRAEVAEDYLDRYFEGWRGHRGWLAEGSVSYLYAPERMEAVLRLWPDARFVIALRDPLKMLPSLHQRLLVTGDENVENFAKAWRLIGERAQGRSIPRSCIDPRFLRYDEIGMLGRHVERFFAAVGRERCFTVLQDDLAADGAKVYADLLAFLGLPHDGRTKFGARRSGAGYRIGWLQRLLKRPPVATRAVLAGEQFRRRVHAKPKRPPSAAAQLVMRWRKALLDWNRAPAPEPKLPPELRQEMADHFRDDVRHLGTLLGRDLSGWLQVR